MPGILPMKVIKVGTSSQSRIAQACDRCRSKKIRCDGIRPCCSQCANVGFECRTSDKLSRRAFPRGYTESLEERVRALETENRELKDLLDEKDEKIEMLSKMHGHHHNRQNHGQASTERLSSPTVPVPRNSQAPPAKEDTFRVQASPLLLGVENSDSYFMGPSSGRSFIEGLKCKLQENGKSCSDFNPEAFLHIQGCPPLTAKPLSSSTRLPPRLFSDRCVNVYFQEWAPLFPVLHKPTFLCLYEGFVADADKVRSNHKTAQLYLVFSIAALSSEQPDMEQVAACEMQWQRALDAILMENTMNTLQCLVLALMYCAIRADYKRLIHYKAVAVALSHRLGLHQSQKRFSFGALTIETRKKVFWTLYSLDCFSAAILGLPKVLREEDIHAEYPADCDDEYVTERGFQPTLPGEYTKISSALALFRLCRVLAKVLEKNYPASTSYELSLQGISLLDAELAEWSEKLPAHLRLTFAQDKPSTEVTGSRSPLLSLAFYYTRTLIHRPAVGSSLGPKDAPSLMAIFEASKHTIQIIQLLEERSMSFSFCLNKTDVLGLCAMTLLYQGMGLKQESKLMRETRRLVHGVLKMLQKGNAPGTVDLKRAASLVIPAEEGTAKTAARKSPKTAMAAPPPRLSPQPPQPGRLALQQGLGRHLGASASETDLIMQQEKLRRMTMPSSSMARPELYRPHSRASIDGGAHEPVASRREKRFSVSEIQQSMMRLSPRHGANGNLDYLSLGRAPRQSPPAQAPMASSPLGSRAATAAAQPVTHAQQTASSSYPTNNVSPGSKAGSMGGQHSGVSVSEWEAILGAMDGGQTNVYDAIYGGPGISITDIGPPQPTTSYDEWSPDSWDLSSLHVGDPGSNTTGPQSDFSLSDESLSSSEELASNDLYAGLGSEELRNSLPQSMQYPMDEGRLVLDGFDLSQGLLQG